MRWPRGHLHLDALQLADRGDVPFPAGDLNLNLVEVGRPRPVLRDAPPLRKAAWYVQREIARRGGGETARESTEAPSIP